jgi:GMP synthase (glutamine-hydrolysing)
MPPRLLVVEGNTAELRTDHVAVGGQVMSDGYADVLRDLLPEAIVDICYPADPGANLPIGGLEGYDGVAITGSALNVYDGGPAIEPQIELARAILKSRTPLFGSCWGLQVITVAAGGTVRTNPKGREIGVARRVALTKAGREHPMYAGKGSVFDAVTVHLDEV